MHLINQYIPNNSPTPLAFGECRNSHRFFILFTFHVLHSGLPSIPNFVSAVAKLHASSRGNSPNGKFGFHITTYNGTLAQDNTWTNTWEDFFGRGMRRMLQLEEEARGPDEELHQLVQPFLHRVIPRLLRPMETSGRKIQPVLIHGDLWIGNISTLADTGEPFIFDSSAFWGHHECEPNCRRHAYSWTNISQMNLAPCALWKTNGGGNAWLLITNILSNLTLRSTGMHAMLSMQCLFHTICL